jgi:hypothetical protein
MKIVRVFHDVMKTLASLIRYLSSTKRMRTLFICFVELELFNKVMRGANIKILTAM